MNCFSLEILYQTVLHQVTSLCQIPNSQSSISSAPISISPAPSPMNATIQSNNLSKNLYMPLEQQENDHAPKPIMKNWKKRKSREELLAENIDREILTALNDEIDEETHFCLSLVDILKKLSPRKNVLAKSKIMSLLVELTDD